MFYTLSTKIPHIMSGKKLLKIFTIGSVCYIISSYFLQLNKSSEKLKFINKYFYYAMAIDFVIASTLVKFYKTEELEDDDINNEINKTVEEVIKIQNENNAEKPKIKQQQKSDK
jgi:mannitol-specific phosphotransferase system IIBC component